MKKLIVFCNASWDTVSNGRRVGFCYYIWDEEWQVWRMCQGRLSSDETDPELEAVNRAKVEVLRWGEKSEISFFIQNERILNILAEEGFDVNHIGKSDIHHKMVHSAASNSRINGIECSRIIAGKDFSYNLEQIVIYLYGLSEHSVIVKYLSPKRRLHICIYSRIGTTLLCSIKELVSRIVKTQVIGYDVRFENEPAEMDDAEYIKVEHISLTSFIRAINGN